MQEEPSDETKQMMNNSVAAVDQQIEWSRSRLWQGDYGADVEQTLHDANQSATALNHMPLKIQALRLLGSFAYLVMNLEQARNYMNKALALALRLKDTAEMLSLGAHLGFVHRAQGEPETALRHLQPFVDKLDLIEITPNLVRPAVSVLLRFTICLLLVHDYDRAEERLHEAELLMERYDTGQYPSEAAAFIAFMVYGWAVIHMVKGDFERAREYTIAYDFATRKLGRQVDVVLVNMLYLRLDLLTDLPAEQKEMAWRNMLVTTLPFLVNKNLHPSVAHHVAQYGFLEEADFYAHHGHSQWAYRFAEQALRIFERIHHEMMIVKTLAIMASLGTVQGKHNNAE